MTNDVAGGEFLNRPIPEDTVFIPEEFTKEHKAIAKTVKEFVSGEIQSRGDEIEHVNNDLSRTLMKRAGEIGLLAADIPEEYDGMALDKISSLIISDVLGQGAGSFTITELNHTGIGTLPLAFFGTESQKQQYLPGLSSGQLIGAFGLTEPDAGSDALNARTTAALSDDGGHYVLNGSKCFITNAGFADLIFTFAKVDGKAFTAFIVEFKADGISTDAEEVKMGMKGTSTRTVNFNNVHVPVGNVLGEVGRGHVVALNALNMGRFKVGAVCVGNARGTFSEAVKYANQRVQFNQPISEFGLIKEKIGDMAIGLFAGESMMYRTAGMIDKKIKAAGEVPAADVGRVTAGALEEYLIECSIMKIYGSEVQGMVADQSVQIFGGYGYIYENPAELAYRNSRINRIWEGTNEINRATIAGTLLKRVAKDRLPLAIDPETLLKELVILPPISEDRPDDLDTQKEMLATAKTVARYMIGTANQTCNGNLNEHQELAGILSDMVIEIYAAESALLRAAKLMSAGAGSQAVAVQMVKVLSVRLFDRMLSLVWRALPALMNGTDCLQRQALLGRCLTPPPIDTIALIRRIADQCIKKKGVPLKAI
ncbi:MAG: acyl-CoA dehydrogenase family protein [Desulfobacteraceae bacterium]|jgi:alkylation response protein AidB-like acyl-CoA dehydrogenase|nr:acyl-CoA dehydrogenase family protein [Desulfobacteraceae bacterium]